MRKIKLTRLHIIALILSVLWITLGTIEVASGCNWLFGSESNVLLFISFFATLSNIPFFIIMFFEANPSGVYIPIIIVIQLLTVGLHWVIFYYIAKYFINIKNKVARKR